MISLNHAFLTIYTTTARQENDTKRCVRGFNLSFF